MYDCNTRCMYLHYIYVHLYIQTPPSPYNQQPQNLHSNVKYLIAKYGKRKIYLALFHLFEYAIFNHYIVEPPAIHTHILCSILVLGTTTKRIHLPENLMYKINHMAYNDRIYLTMS